MNIQNKLQSVIIPTNRNSGETLTNLNAPATGNPTPADAQKAAWTQFERVLAKRESPVKSNAAESSAAQAAQKSFQEQFSGLAGDKEKFHSLMKEVYGNNYNAEAAENFRQRALTNDNSWLPKIEFQPDAVLAGANGAYDASRNVVYINAKYENDPTRAAKVYSEEVGAFLDTKLNTSDTVGDEGEMFRKLLAGQKLSDAEKAAIRADNDHGVITVNGKATEVEFSLFDDIGGAIKDAAKSVGGAIKDAAKSVGGAVKDGAKKVGGFLGKEAKLVGGFFKGVGETMWEALKIPGGWASSAWDAAKWVGGKVADGAKWAGGKIGDAAKWVGGFAVKEAKLIGGFFKGVGETMWEALKIPGGWASSAWDAAKSVGGKIADGAKWAGGKIGDAAKWVGGFAVKEAKLIGGFFKGVGETMWEALKIPGGWASSAWDAAKSVGGKIADGVKSVGSKLSEAWNSIF